MYISSDLMPDDSKIWIYQSTRVFTDEEASRIISLARDFVTGWTAHDNALKASFELRYNAFLILMIDESLASASGCSIDKSVQLIRQIEKEFSVSMLDRQVFAFKESGMLKFSGRKEFEGKLDSGEINDETIVFNNLIHQKSELDSSWEIPLKQSWHRKLFKAY